MANTWLYRMRFRSPLHIGERGVGLEETQHHVPADTLFSALCTAWRWLYGADSLQQDLLEPFQSPDAPPFLLTSAFPFAGDVLFYPKPLTLRAQDSQSTKSLKSVQWISHSILARWVQGERLTFTPSQCVAGGSIWMTDEERAQLTDFVDDETGDLLFWKYAAVPRVTLDRLTCASQIWFFGQVTFVRGAGLWCGICYRNQGVRQRVEACLRLLGDSGLGGERGAGCGLFDLEIATEPISLPENASGDYLMTLAPCCPTPEQVGLLLDERCAYHLMPRRGWVGSPEGGSFRRQTVWMLGEGSVIKRIEAAFPGSLVNVKPDPCPHPVWRYGYAFPLGVKG